MIHISVSHYSVKQMQLIAENRYLFLRPIAAESTASIP